jgi:hypothetical protein
MALVARGLAPPGNVQPRRWSTQKEWFIPNILSLSHDFTTHPDVQDTDSSSTVVGNILSLSLVTRHTHRNFFSSDTIFFASDDKHRLFQPRRPTPVLLVQTATHDGDHITLGQIHFNTRYPAKKKLENPIAVLNLRQVRPHKKLETRC